jgi:hypothetical protein
MWASRRHRNCQLLLLPDQQQLVVLVDRRHAAPKSPSRFSLAGLAVKSPFASGHSRFRTAGCVHTFEVPFASLRGLDYSNPLCLEARLVLEVSNLRKREFSTVGVWVGGRRRVVFLLHRDALRSSLWLMPSQGAWPASAVQTSALISACAAFVLCADGGCSGLLFGTLGHPTATHLPQHPCCRRR